MDEQKSATNFRFIDLCLQSFCKAMNFRIRARFKSVVKTRSFYTYVLRVHLHWNKMTTESKMTRAILQMTKLHEIHGYNHHTQQLYATINRQLKHPRRKSKPGDKTREKTEDD
jgi:hypothetical protein